MPASAAYLTKYLTASNGTSRTKDTKSTTNNDFEDSNRPKKRRKKDKSQSHNTDATEALLIADDDEALSLRNVRKGADSDDEDAPLVLEGRIRSTEFRRKKGSVWQTVQDEATPENTPQEGTTMPNQQRSSAQAVDDNDTDADRILAAAASESNARRLELDLDDAPAIVETTIDSSAPKMSSGAKAGIQTASDTAALLAAEQARESAEQQQQRSHRKKSRRKDTNNDDPDPSNPTPVDTASETIYRDATGRRIDISLRRQEVRAAEAAKQAAEKREREAATGEVQVAQKAQAKQELEDAKFLTLGRDVEDEELNERQRGVLRWDDPMAAYIAQQREGKRKEEGGGAAAAAAAGVGTGRSAKKEYMGAAPPNRYGIRPGWRWDGVDRGCGFEKEWFQARGKKDRNRDLEYQWQVDE